MAFGRRRRRERISFLVPFRAHPESRRAKNWRWLEEYWEHHFPTAEIIIGQDRRSRKRRIPFSKSVAVNNAFRRSCGDVIVILDADAYLPADVLDHCVERIRAARRSGTHVWFIPYTFIYRLNHEGTQDLVRSEPCDPYEFSTPPDVSDVEPGGGGSGPGEGRKYGAMIQILPREAFEAVGGMDARFRGWGGEDVSFVRAVDTLWGKHKNVPGDVLHLSHEKFHIGEEQNYQTRVWEKQTAARSNEALATRYHHAGGDPVKMQRLLDER